MEVKDGYMRAALSLRELPADEQMWVLEQLDDDDRLRIGEALQALRDAEIKTAVVPEKPEPASEAAMPADADFATILNRANSNLLASILMEQPDWATAVMIAEYPKNEAVKRLIGQLSQDRMDRLRRLAKDVRGRVKTRVRATVLNIVAEQLKQRMAAESEALEFEAVLGRYSSLG